MNEVCPGKVDTQDNRNWSRRNLPQHGTVRSGPCDRERKWFTHSSTRVTCLNPRVLPRSTRFSQVDQADYLRGTVFTLLTPTLESQASVPWLHEMVTKWLHEMVTKLAEHRPVELVAISAFCHELFRSGRPGEPSGAHPSGPEGVDRYGRQTSRTSRQPCSRPGQRLRPSKNQDFRAIRQRGIITTALWTSAPRFVKLRTVLRT